MSAIHLQNLVKRFGDFTALRTKDLSIADGEFMALLGPSGCGKSTTMNMIAGMATPSEGRILFGGRDMTGVPMGRRGVGFVFQNYAIFSHMSVRWNLDYGLRMARRQAAEIAQRTATMAGMLGLTDLLDRPASAYVARLLGAPVLNILPFASQVLAAPIPPGATHLGVRPENLGVTPQADGPAIVSGVESPGSYKVLTIDAQGETLRAMLRGQTAFQAGTPVGLSADPARLHYFEPDGASLSV